jgi:hypothetical protein
MSDVGRAYEAENRAFAGLAVGGVLIVAAIVISVLLSWVFGLIAGAIGVGLLARFAVRVWV